MTSLPPPSPSPDLINQTSPLVALGQLHSPGAGESVVGSLPAMLGSERGSASLLMEERAREEWKSLV